MHSLDTKDESRLSRTKCSGEVPSCETCIGKGKQCEGYNITKTIKRQRQVAATQRSIRSFSNGATLQSPGHSTHHQISAPPNHAMNLPVEQALHKNAVTNNTTLTYDSEDYSVDTQPSFLFRLFQHTKMIHQYIIYLGL